MDDGLETFVLFMAAAAEEEEAELSPEERRRRSGKFPGLSIRKHSQSPFKCMLSKGNDQALSNCCGIDHKAFHELLNCFEPVFNQHTINRNTGLIKHLPPSKDCPEKLMQLVFLDLLCIGVKQEVVSMEQFN